MDESPKTNNPIPPLAIFGIVLYLFCYVSVMIWGYYLVNGIAMTISFLIIYYYLDLILEKITFLKNADYRQQIYFLFFFSCFLNAEKLPVTPNALYFLEISLSASLYFLEYSL